MRNRSTATVPNTLGGYIFTASIIFPRILSRLLQADGLRIEGVVAKGG